MNFFNFLIKTSQDYISTTHKHQEVHSQRNSENVRPAYTHTGQTGRKRRCTTLKPVRIRLSLTADYVSTYQPAAHGEIGPALSTRRAGMDGMTAPYLMARLSRAEVFPDRRTGCRWFHVHEYVPLTACVSTVDICVSKDANA